MTKIMGPSKTAKTVLIALVLASLVGITFVALAVNNGTSSKTNIVIPSGRPTILTAAGDLGGSANEIAPVANVIKGINPDVVSVPGDLVYPDGEAIGYDSFFNQVYGPLTSKIIASPGNHDYHQSGGSGFYGYFIGQAKDLVSVDIGNNWRMEVINTEEGVSSGSPAEVKLKADLAANVGKHIIAITHHPRYTNGSSHGPMSGLDAMWKDLDDAKADVFIAGHNHQYERFQPMGPGNALRDEGAGVRQFVAGTGGNGLYSFKQGQSPGSQFQDGTHWGAVKFTLADSQYCWSFETTNGLSLDQGCAPTRTGGGVVTTTTTQAATTTTTQATTTTTTLPSNGGGSGCLKDKNPVRKITGVQSGKFRTSSPLPANSGIDATGASWTNYSDTSFPITFAAGDNACWHGGKVTGLWPYDAPWTTFHSSGAINLKGGTDHFVIDGLRVDNFGDALRLEENSTHSILVNNWVTRGHDDCVEDDHLYSVLIVDNLFEGCYVGFSTRPSGTVVSGATHTFAVVKSLVWLQPIPGVYKGTSPGTGPFFKWDEAVSDSPRIATFDTVYRADQKPNHGTLGFPTGYDVRCSGNVVLWTGSGDFPDRASWMSKCPDTVIVTGPNAKVMWDQAASAWKASH